VKFTLINKVSIISVTVLISGKLRNLRICAKEFQYNSSIWGFGGNGASVEMGLRWKWGFGGNGASVEMGLRWRSG
jgi:hypothetical protein